MKKLFFVQGFMFAALTASAFADVSGTIVLSDRDRDGRATLNIEGETAEAIYTMLNSAVQIGDPIASRGYTQETSLKVGRDLSCTKTRFQRLPQEPGRGDWGPGDRRPVGPVGPGDGGRDGWGRGGRPGNLQSYTVYSCQTQLNADGRVGNNNYSGPGPR